MTNGQREEDDAVKRGDVKRWLRGLESVICRIVAIVPSQRVRRVAYRAGGMRIGRDSWIYSGAEVRAPYRISIGKGTVVGFRSTLDGRGGLEIGDGVNLSSEVAIWTMEHDLSSADFSAFGAAVTIGDYAWLSARSTILPGVSIGRGAVVAAGAVVTRDVEPNVVVGGVPARPIGKRPLVGTYELGRPLPFV